MLPILSAPVVLSLFAASAMIVTYLWSTTHVTDELTADAAIESVAVEDPDDDPLSGSSGSRMREARDGIVWGLFWISYVTFGSISSLTLQRLPLPQNFDCRFQDFGTDAALHAIGIGW